VEEITGENHQAIIYEDNLGAIYLAKNQQVSGRTKHIDIRHHWLRDLQTSKRIDIRFKRSDDNSADIMTKNSTKDLFEKHIKAVRTGNLTCWKEDVKSDPSVTMFDRTEVQNDSQS
jgi:predicted sulfurtransferase